MQRRNNAKLILFDMDQTLFDDFDIHDRAFKLMFKEVYGIDASLGEIDYAGKAVESNIAEICLLHGISKKAINAKIPKALKSIENKFIQSLPKDIHKYIFPGVVEILKKLRKKKCIIGLTTGSRKKEAEAIINAAKLTDYFDFILTSNEAKTKYELVEKAILKAESMAKAKFKIGDIVVIGDSIRDIDAGKRFKAKTIAVATGATSIAELKKHKPDYLFNNLRKTDEVLRAILI